MNKKFCLRVAYNDGKKYERHFDELSEVPPFIKENYLKYGIASIIFADDMSEVENTDFEALFENIVQENDLETMALYGEHIDVWKNLVATNESVEKAIEVFNERYSKELTNEPKLKFIRRNFSMTDAAKKKDVIKIAFKKMTDKYGTEVPLKIRSRFENERMLLEDKDALIYLRILKRVRHYAEKSGYATYTRGDIASSFISYILGATDINPLEPHYYCPKCHKVEFVDGVYDAWDLPVKHCECGNNMLRDGHNINFELSRIAFGDLAQYGISVPEQGFDAIVSEIKDELKGYSVCEKTPFGEVKTKQFFVSLDKPITNDDTESQMALVGEYNSFAVFSNSLLTTLHNMGKNEINETEVFNCDLNKVSFDDIGIFNCLEFQEIKNASNPTQLSDLLKIAGLIMGTGTWNDMIENALKTGSNISETIAFRDDLYNLIKCSLSKMGIQDTGISHLITTRANRGRYSRLEDLFCSDKQMLEEMGISKMAINSLRKIKYLMPKAHIIPLVTMSIIAAQIKNKCPEEFDKARKLCNTRNFHVEV